MKTPTLFLVLTLSVGALFADEFAPLFPFVITGDVGGNITDVSAWNDAPAGKHGFIRVEGDTFVNDQGRVLFWGTNTCFSMNFPEKVEAEKVAARFARLGFNCVRLHHMDREDIWGGRNAKSLTVIDPAQLDKLDYYIYQLKKKGIYVNLNLHVSRQMDERDGFADKDKRPRLDKGLDNFYPPFIELQKKYAQDLLEHVNPYTKTAYKDEPAIAMIEINNENSVVSQWARGDGTILNMPPPYSTEFRRQWNEFLKAKYKTADALAEAWGHFDIPLGDEMLVVTPDRDETKKWTVEAQSDTKYKRTSLGNGIMRLEVEDKGSRSFHPQLLARNLKVEKGKPYTFTFRAKADGAKTVTLLLRRNLAPWNNIGFRKVIDLTTEWQTFSFTFRAAEDEGKARFDITGIPPGSYEFADSSLKPGGAVTLKADQRLEAGTVPLVDKTGSGLSAMAANDFCEFLFDIENKYWPEMYRFIKDELGAKQPISGTQMGYGSTTIQAKLDYADNHAYWNHPQFPGRRWDSNNWTVSNQALVNHLDANVLPGLATARPAGKPYMVSEFDSPYPNQYCAEALPILAAFGRFQGWDGFFHFAYSHSRAKINQKRASGFFDMAGNTVKLAYQPACAAMFRRGDVAEGKTVILGGMDAVKELELFKHGKRFNFQGIGLDPRLGLLHRTALDLTGEQTDKIPEIPIRQSGRVFTYSSDTEQLSAVMELKNGGNYTVNTPNSKLFTGFQTDDTVSLKDVSIKCGKTRLNWATIAIVSMNGNNFDPATANGKPIRILVTATGQMLNTDMVIEQLGRNRITVGSRWGKEPVLCEGIPFSLRFEKAKALKCFPLDEDGNRRDEIKSDGNTVELGPQYKTVWYEIELR